MSGHVAAAALVREATRRHLSEPQPVAPDRGRAALALLLQRAAHRLDPYVTAPPRAQVEA